MRIVIIEDEHFASSRLQNLLMEVMPEAEVIANIKSVAEGVKWFDHGSVEPDLIFSDIQLGDGISFDIFAKHLPQCPIIFTTAYDEYAVRAFKLNSIDYLLKPIKKTDLEQAVDKYYKLNKPKPSINPSLIDEIISGITKGEPTYKVRFVIKIGEQLLMINTSDINCLVSKNKDTFVIDHTGKHLPLDDSLDKIESTLDPKKFFRINRKFIVNIDKVKSITAYSGSRLKLDLHQFSDTDLVVARDKTADFKKWLEQGN